MKIKYSKFEKYYMMCFAAFFIIVIFSVGVAWGIFKFND